MAVIAPTDPAFEAYEAFAPYYDRYTETYGHEVWLANIEQVALGLGLSGRRLLDIGCGTGKSFMPLLERGYDVMGCDVSPEMVERARRRAGPGRADVVVADARDLPQLGEFDLVTSLDDCLNYLLTDDELAAAFDGVARNLRPDGLFIFDLNSLATYRGAFSMDAVSESAGAFFCWRGAADPDAQPGTYATATIEVFSTDDGECWRRTTSQHVQRHHPLGVVARLLEDAGLDLVELRGQITGEKLEKPADEDRHAKVVYFARKAHE